MGIARWWAGRRRAFWEKRGPGLVEFLSRTAVEDFEKGKLDWAVRDVANARRISREWLGQEDNRSLRWIQSSVAKQFQAGATERVAELCRRWIEVVADQLSRGLPYPEYLDDLDEILLFGGDYPGIEARLRDLEERLRRSQDQEPALLWVLMGLGRIARSAARTTEAEPPLREAAALWERIFGATGRGYAARLDELAEVLTVNGNHRETAELAQRALDALRSDSSAPIDPVEDALRNIGLASIHMVMLGEPARAKELLRQADLALRKAAERESLDPSPVARRKRVAQFIANNHSYILSYLRKLKTLDISRRERYLEAFSDFEPSGSPLEWAESQFFLLEMNLEMSLGRDPSSLIDEAFIETFFAPLEPLFDLPDVFAEFPDSDQMLELVRHLDPVKPSYDRALDNLTEHSEPFPPHIAESMLRTAVEKRAEALGANHPQTALARYKLAQFLERRGESQEAESLLREALASWKEVFEEGHLLYLQGLRGLAALCDSTHRPEEAWSLLREAAAIEDRIIANIFSFTSEEQRMTFLRSIEETYRLSLDVAWKLGGEPPEVAREAFALVLRRKGVVGRAQLAQWESAVGGQHPAIEDRVRELAEVRQRITDVLLAGESPEDAEISALNGRRESLEAELAREAAGSALLREMAPVDLEAFCQALPPASALVEIVRLQAWNVFRTKSQSPGYLAFVLPAGDLDGLRMVGLGQDGDIDLDISSLRQAVIVQRGLMRDLHPTQRSGSDPGEAAALRLRENLIDPILELLGNRTRLLISPDDELSLLPFEILPDGESGHLVDRFTVSYVSSGREALRFGAAFFREPDGPVVVAEPDYNLGSDHLLATTSKSHFMALEHAPLEGEEIARLLGVVPWTGAEALETRLRKLRSPRILHLATHGFLFSNPGPSSPLPPGRLSNRKLEDPLLQSGLALAGANTWLRGGQPPPEAGDGLLTAAEVATLDLVDTELVVLSACKTGLGEVRAGEGVLGLRRSFALAGARTLVMSLWQVPDRETRELMETFYGHLLAGEGRAEALRLAQLALKRRGHPPLVWGAFICQGDPGPLRFRPGLPNTPPVF